MVIAGKTEATNREETTLLCLTEMSKMTNVIIAVKLVTTKRTARQSHAPMLNPVKLGMIETRITKGTKTAPSNDRKSIW